MRKLLQELRDFIVLNDDEGLIAHSDMIKRVDTALTAAQQNGNCDWPACLLKTAQDEIAAMVEKKLYDNAQQSQAIVPDVDDAIEDARELVNKLENEIDQFYFSTARITSRDRVDAAKAELIAAITKQSSPSAASKDTVQETQMGQMIFQGSVYAPTQPIDRQAERIAELEYALRNMKQCFVANMLAAYPKKSHGEIEAEIEKVTGANTPPQEERTKS